MVSLSGVYVLLEAHWVAVLQVLVDHPVDDDEEHVAVGRTVGQAVDVDGVTHLVGTGAWAPVRSGLAAV